MGKDPLSGKMHVALYMLLRYLGRSGQMSKKIIRDGLSECDFFERVGKQLLYEKNSDQLTLEVVKTYIL